MTAEQTARWALWNYETEEWDEVPAENAPGEWNGGHRYGAALSAVERTWPDGCRTSATTTAEEHAECDRILERYRAARAASTPEHLPTCKHWDYQECDCGFEKRMGI
jgi:hypothetical protein